MSSLLYNNKVVATGTFEKKEDGFWSSNNEFFPFPIFSDATVIQEEPPKDGQWMYIEGKFIEIMPQEIPQVQPPVQPVPSSVTPRQARLVLALQPSPDTSYPNLLAFVENAFDSLQEPDRTLAKISWEYATSIERSSDLIAQMQGILGLTSEQIDDLFRQATKL